MDVCTCSFLVLINPVFLPPATLILFPISCNGLFFPDPERIGVLLTNSIYEAYSRTCLFTSEQIREQWRMGVDQSKLFAFKSMVK